MTFETIKKKLSKALEPRPTTITKRGDYFLVKTELAVKGKLIGGYSIDAELDFDGIAAQCTEVEALGVENGVYIMLGTSIILLNSMAHLAMTELVIPDSVTEIERGDFMNYCGFTNCKNLTKVVLSKNLTRIPDSCFEGCSALKNIEIPAGVKEIYSKAFKECTSLTDITLPDGLTKIGDCAFSDCTMLTSIVIPAGVKKIYWYAFKDCSSLTDITLPDGLTEIGYDAFRNCSALKSLDVPASVTEIDSDAFNNCTSLTNVTLVDGLTKIGDHAFSNCSALKSLDIPASVTEIGDNAFKDSGLPEPIIFNGELVYVPNTLEEYAIPEGVTQIGDELFKGITTLKKVTIPSSVTKIGGGAFEDCTALLEVVIPDNVTEIGACVFKGCTALQRATLSKGLTVLPSSTFRGCTVLKNVEVPEGITKIEGSAFFDCTALQCIKLPESLVEIESYAFCYVGLTSLTLPSKLLKLGSCAFEECNSLTEVTLTNPNLSLYKSDWDESAFRRCTAITNVNLPNGVTWGKVKDKFSDSPWSKSNPARAAANAKKAKAEELKGATFVAMAKSAIGDFSATVEATKEALNIEGKTAAGGFIVAFYELDNSSDPMKFDWEPLKQIAASAKPGELVTINIPMTKWGEYVMKLHATNINIPAGTTRLDGVFTGCTTLESVTLPEGLEHISGSTFMDCIALTNITFPASLKYIGFRAFSGCKALKSISLPASMEAIYDEAFAGCDTLEGEIHIPSTLTDFGKNVFRNCPRITHIVSQSSQASFHTDLFATCPALIEISSPKWTITRKAK